MTPIEYVRAAYRYRALLKFELTAAVLLGLIMTYHAMTSPLLNWLAR